VARASPVAEYPARTKVDSSEATLQGCIRRHTPARAGPRRLAYITA
jgi:hypothetical protein